MMYIAYIANMSNKPSSKKASLQLRIQRADKRGSELAEKLEKIASVSGLSVNDVANMSVAAGLGIVERKLKEIHAPTSDLQPA
jgi:hypothetical protein